MAGMTVDSLADEVSVAVVAGVLLDHDRVDEAQAHLGLAIRVDEDLIKRVPARCLADGFNFAAINGQIRFRVGAVDVELGLDRKSVV